MSLPQLFALSVVEIIGDFGFKIFANKGGWLPFTLGLVGYAGVVCMLIVTLQNSSVLLVNSAWDGISGILEGMAAYIFLGERFHSPWQYLGILFVSLGLFLLKIPIRKTKPFHIPRFF